jgi:hypothetical protein
VSELARHAVGRLLALCALTLASALILRGVPSSGPQCLPAHGPLAELALRLSLLGPAAGCSHGSLALTAAGVIVAASLLATLLLTATRAWAAARRVWLAAPSGARRLLRVLRHLAAPLPSPSGGHRDQIDTTPTELAPQWVPSLRLRRGPPAVGRPLPA